ncbi:MAG: uroporphyrinogen decarboxylase family protein [Anaerolineae bacterium]
MNTRDRFRNILRGRPVDRLPRFEWAIWWQQTIDRWHAEGMPIEKSAWNDYGVTAIMEYWGLDPAWQAMPRSSAPTMPPNLWPDHLHGPVADMASYEDLRPHLYYHDPDWDKCLPPEILRRHERGELTLWFSLSGFFAPSRHLMGVMRQFTAFYDHPDLIKRINEETLAWDLWALEEICKRCAPDFMTIGEDVTYNHGPMLSKAMFDEFMAPYYRVLTPAIRKHDIVTMVDSDGNVNELCLWLHEVGVQGLLPFEVQAGSDISLVRAQLPDFRVIGGFDKMVMTRGPEAVRAEFERLLPEMRRGYFIPSVDHQTPPGVSSEQYREYLALLWEYTAKAAE